MKVPLSVNEATITTFHERDPRTGHVVADESIDALAASVGSARAAAEALVAFRTTTLADTTRTADARRLAIRKQALRLAESQGPRLDAARQRVQGDLAAIEREIHAPPAIDAGLAAEIRAALRGMAKGDREKLIGEAIAANDEELLAALLRGRGFMVGVSESRLTAWRDAWQRAHRAQAYARRQRLQKAMEAQDRAGRAFLGMVRGAIEEGKTPQELQAAAEAANDAIEKGAAA